MGGKWATSDLVAQGGLVLLTRLTQVVFLLDLEVRVPFQLGLVQSVHNGVLSLGHMNLLDLTARRVRPNHEQNPARCDRPFWGP